jgi:hypothetical protein
VKNGMPESPMKDFILRALEKVDWSYVELSIAMIKIDQRSES